MNAHTKVLNYFIQQFATADMIPVAITYKWHRLKANSMRSFIVNTVHDSDITELHPEEHDIYKDITKQSYTTDVYKYFDVVYGHRFYIPLGVEYKSGSNWGYDDALKEKLY